MQHAELLAEIRTLESKLAERDGVITALVEALSAAQEVGRVAEDIIHPRHNNVRSYEGLQQTAIWKSTQAAWALEKAGMAPDPPRAAGEGRE